MRKALITGVTGQDGAYLAAYLLERGYKVYGTYRRTSTRSFERLEYLRILNEIEMIPLDLLDQCSIIHALRTIAPDEIYNLAAQSFVGASFKQPVVTGEINGLGTIRILEAITSLNFRPRFYQASTSEMFGNGGKHDGLSEESPFHPRSPYAASKLYAHWATVNYREAYGLFACCGILFNHESPLRGIEFVTRKITDAVARIKYDLQDKLELGNIDSNRDWGYAKDYVEAMWLMLQQDDPDDYVISTGESHSVREFAEIAFSLAGLEAKDYIKTDPILIRPTDTIYLRGNPAKAIRKLGWNPTKTTLPQLINLMVEADLKRVKDEVQNRTQVHGFQRPAIVSSR
jgi:GDPmannose 4,6-dehydratase